MSAGELNERAANAIRRAMVLTGTDRNLSGFARILSGVTGGQGTTHSSVRRWLEGGTVPAWALLAAAEAAHTSVGALFEEPATELAQEVARQAEEIRRLWGAVGGEDLAHNPLVDGTGGVDEERTRQALRILGDRQGEGEES